ncbi:hypothetical protein AYO20_07922 [Fonsecaea nubica]|uniref:Uncharacterized protein n=1 Tax=Fonsecaea nubica TaxID=856822 RepID=A0A178CTV4_9EURO|nr:hypothetical protein AYO20_07922 [Fonsecaea nubica]OAL32612.1 hypothetical protein AYO20_07922 [Fonsecaea nubica]
MSPSVLMDTSDDFVMPAFKAPQSSNRTLLLSPPSLSSHQEILTGLLEMHDRAHTDLQMLDRLSLGLVSLPQSTYDVITILSDADGSRRESQNLISRDILALLVKALKSGGHLRSQDGSFGAMDGPEKTETILAGLSFQPGVGFVKPNYGAQDSVPLRFGRKKTSQAAGGLTSARNGESVSLPVNGKRKSTDDAIVPAGVGFDDGMDDSDDELIDEDTLLDEEDLKRPIKIPQKLEAEDRARRENADKALNTMKLQADDLAEVDFTVQGKVGSCGNCSLGDAFRCDGCPYIGLPAFKPGEEVRLLNNEIQL